MSALAEDSVDLSRGARVLRLVALLAGIALLVAAGMWLKDLFSKPSAPTRQVTKISIIPDTPPPPPPPPKEEKRPEPPKDMKEVKEDVKEMKGSVEVRPLAVPDATPQRAAASSMRITLR